MHSGDAMTSLVTVMMAVEDEPGHRGIAVVADSGGLDLLARIEQLPETSVPIRSLAQSCYLRQAGTDAVHVKLLADAAATDKLPPILVQKGSLRIIDGMHRVEVARLRGELSISARMVDCTDEEALVLAVKANTLHGLPLSRADRISGAKRILANHPDWSDRALAKVAGLSAKTIASLRNSAADKTQFNLKRIGRDGKRRPVVFGEGRRRVVEYINAHPEAPIREIARATEVSVGTVYDVREKARCHALLASVESGQPAAEASVGGAVVATPPLSPAQDPPAQDPPAPGSPAEGSSEQRRPGVRKAGSDRGQLTTWPAISAKLANDPTLRYTDGGRAFLRWMAMHSTHCDEWREFIDAIPSRWLKQVEEVAASMKEEWQEFTVQLSALSRTQPTEDRGW
jgi:hypothetical protein